MLIDVLVFASKVQCVLLREGNLPCGELSFLALLINLFDHAIGKAIVDFERSLP